MFVVVYFALFGTGIGYMMRLVRKGRRPAKARSTPGGPGQKRTPARPLSAADDGHEATSTRLSEGN
jgi:cytochrome d ubiquinol oxidase subunit I